MLVVNTVVYPEEVEVPHLTDQTSRTFRIHGVTFHSYASGASGANEMGGWRADFAPHTPGQPHRMSHEELLYILDGSLEVEVDDEHFVADSGDAVVVPAGARFRVSNTGAEPAQAWVTTRLGMTAEMEVDCRHLAPPWAQ
jgi:quercetin dioxygenase-like cupin family protein